MNGQRTQEKKNEWMDGRIMNSCLYEFHKCIKIKIADGNDFGDNDGDDFVSDDVNVNGDRNYEKITQ